MQFLVEKCKANVLYASKTGTPLISAIDALNLQVVKYLVEGPAKVSVNHRDANGMSAYYYAVYKGDLPIFHLLNRQESPAADPFALGIKGSNVIHVCAERNFLQIAQEIIEKDKEKNIELIFQTTESGGN